MNKEFTLQQVILLKKGLEQLIKKEFSAATAYKISKIFKKINEENEAIEETRINLIKKYSENEGNEEDKVLKVAKDKESDFFAEFANFLQEKIELTFTPIKMSELKNISITTELMLVLEEIIIDDISDGDM